MYRYRYQPAIAPRVIASSALSTLLRSSRMCSISGMRPSGLGAFRPRSRRAPRDPADRSRRSWADITWAGLERLAVLRVGRRRAVPGRARPARRLPLQILQLALDVQQLLLGSVRSDRLAGQLLSRRRQHRGHLGDLRVVDRLAVLIQPLYRLLENG